MIKLFIGIDPSAINAKTSGAICINVRSTTGQSLFDSTHCILLKQTMKDVNEQFSEILGQYPDKEKYAIIEKVWILPKQGASGMTEFITGYGFLLGLLVAHKIPFVQMVPKTWQSHFTPKIAKDRSEHKNDLKQIAQNTSAYPKITLYNCDAILIALYLQKNFSKLF